MDNQAIQAVDPKRVPNKILNNGLEMPVVGLGTFGSDRFGHDEVATAVKQAIILGYRHIDCASVYGNEANIGKKLSELWAEGQISREEVWITSKVWNDKHEDVINSCKQSLKDLQLEYLDLYLVHWPFPNFHPSGCDVSSRSPDAKPYIHENYMKTWRQMEQLLKMGLVKSIGTSNMTIPKMKLLLRDCEVKPAVNEMELHPHFQQNDFFNYLNANSIQAIGYTPVGSPARPDRDRTDTDTVDVEDSVLVKIAENHKLHPADICIKWAVQRGQIPIPFSLNPRHFLSNLRSSFTDPLTRLEMKEIEGIDNNCRLIKGQVFLWKNNQSWEDLWDMDGEITLP
jgi:alcohol dehydrogenase (NADP+)